MRQPAPEPEVEISHELVRRLVGAQFPHLADLALGEQVEGWDNVTTRLGPGLAVRMTRRAAAVELADKEIDWLPRMSPGWTFPAPVPVHVGAPGHGYPWRWSIVPWFEGEEAVVTPLGPAGARDLGAALREIHVTPPDDAPVNPYRSVPLAARTTVFRERLATLGAIARSEGRTLDIDAIDREWRRAERQPRDLGVRWIHADLHGRNVLSRGGRLAAILDWGDAAGGDPARDLGQVWLLLAIEDIPLAFDAYGGISEATEIRCRGEALYSAVTLGILDEPTQAHAAWATLVTMGFAGRT